MQRFFLPELPIAGGQTYEESGLLVGSDGNARFPPFAKALRMGHPASGGRGGSRALSHGSEEVFESLISLPTLRKKREGWRTQISVFSDFSTPTFQ